MGIQTPGPVGEPGIGVCHEARGPFVSGHHVANLFLALMQSFVEWNIGVAGHAEDCLDAVAVSTSLPEYQRRAFRLSFCA